MKFVICTGGHISGVKDGDPLPDRCPSKVQWLEPEHWGLFGKDKVTREFVCSSVEVYELKTERVNP